MTDQTTLFGDDRPDDLTLGSTQRAVVRAMRALDGPMNRAEIGAVVHDARGKHPIDETCEFCGVDADPVARSLVTRGIAEPVPDGGYRIRRVYTAARTDDTEGGADVFPPGF